MNTQEHSVIVSHHTPLISNLDMCENIALIKEFHENLSVRDAEDLALEMLQVLELEHIARYRAHKCSHEERLLVMMMRAMMCQEKSIIIKLPSEILGNLLTIQKTVERVTEISKSKNIVILDLVTNKIYYEGSACHIET